MQVAYLKQKSKGNVVKNRKEDILHSGRLGSFSPTAASYTSSIDIDTKLLDAVIAINCAHMLMLYRQGVVNSSVAGRIISVLQEIPKNMVLKEELEDVHMNVEDFVISRIGKDVGGMMNLGKSRNDQVATALRLALREDLLLVGKALIGLEKEFLSKASIYAATFMPGYTHLQRGQPVTVGHHLIAHFDSLSRDVERLSKCIERVNCSPMGAGALASTSLPIDREYVARLLGFDSLIENSLDAVSSRDFATEAIYVCSQILTDLSRFAEELIIWTTKEFGFAEISDRFASTSSMMPQKKNAVVPEITRAKTSQVLGDLVGALGILKSLPLSYNLDLQELSRNLWSSIEKTRSSLLIFSEMIAELSFNSGALKSATMNDDFLYATELADYLVSKWAISFREAHARVAMLAKYCSEHKETLGDSNQLRKLGEQKISKILGVKITSKEIRSLLDPGTLLAKQTATGSPNPRMVRKACAMRRKNILIQERILDSFRKRFKESRALLIEAQSKVAGKYD